MSVLSRVRARTEAKAKAANLQPKIVFASRIFYASLWKLRADAKISQLSFLFQHFLIEIMKTQTKKLK